MSNMGDFGVYLVHMAGYLLPLGLLSVITMLVERGDKGGSSGGH